MEKGASASRTFGRALGALVLMLSALAACKRSAPSGATTATAETPQPSAAATAATPTVTVVLAFGSEKKSWLSDAITRFNDKAVRLPSGELVRIEGQAVGSGAAVEDLVDGTVKAHAWAPASTM